MKLSLKLYLCMTMIIVATSDAAALTLKPLPPSQVNRSIAGPSLESSLAFITEAVNAQGELHASLVGRDLNSSKNLQGNWTSDEKISKGFNECSVHSDDMVDGNPHSEYFDFKDASSIKVATLSQNQTSNVAARQDGAWQVSAIPEIYQVRIFDSLGKDVWHFSFRTKEMAIRVANAVAHVGQICGGGNNKQPF